MCLGAIHWARISRIHYGFSIADAAAIGFDDTKFFQQFALPPEQRDIPSTSLCRDDALQLASDYTSLPNKRSY